MYRRRRPQRERVVGGACGCACAGRRRRSLLVPLGADRRARPAAAMNNPLRAALAGLEARTKDVGNAWKQYTDAVASGKGTSLAGVLDAAAGKGPESRKVDDEVRKAQGKPPANKGPALPERRRAPIKKEAPKDEKQSAKLNTKNPKPKPVTLKEDGQGSGVAVPLAAGALLGVAVLAGAVVLSQIGKSKRTARRRLPLGVKGNSAASTPTVTPAKRGAGASPAGAAGSKAGNSSAGWLLLTVKKVDVEPDDRARVKSAFVKVDLVMPMSMQKKRTLVKQLDDDGQLTFDETCKFFIPVRHDQGEVQVRLVREGSTGASILKCGIYLKAVMFHAPFEHAFPLYKSDKKTKGAAVLIKAEWSPVGDVDVEAMTPEGMKAMQDGRRGDAAGGRPHAAVSGHELASLQARPVHT